MESEQMYGTNRDGSKTEDYCAYCYKDGQFTPECTMEEMIEFCIKPCLDHNVYPDAETARADMMKSFPKLKRWQ